MGGHASDEVWQDYKPVGFLLATGSESCYCSRCCCWTRLVSVVTYSATRVRGRLLCRRERPKQPQATQTATIAFCNIHLALGGVAAAAEIRRAAIPSSTMKADALRSPPTPPPASLPLLLAAVVVAILSLSSASTAPPRGADSFPLDAARAASPAGASAAAAGAFLLPARGTRRGRRPPRSPRTRPGRCGLPLAPAARPGGDDGGTPERDDDDDDDDERGRGDVVPVDSVSWLPSVFSRAAPDEEETARLLARRPSASGGASDCEVLPLLIDRETYLPLTAHSFRIPEPRGDEDGEGRASRASRFREVRAHLRRSGGDEFVSTLTHPIEVGVLARYGVLFRVEGAREIAEEEEEEEGERGGRGRVVRRRRRRVARCSAVGRVEIRGVANVREWTDTETCPVAVVSRLREGERLPAAADDVSSEERALRRSLAELAEMRRRDLGGEESPRLDVRSSTPALGAGRDDAVRDDDPGLWRTIAAWHDYADRRYSAWWERAHRDFWAKRADFLSVQAPRPPSANSTLVESPPSRRFDVLCPTAELRLALGEVRSRWEEEMLPFRIEHKLSMQRMVEAGGREERAKLLRGLVDAELRRLEARRAVCSALSANERESSLPWWSTASESASLEEIRSLLNELVGGFGENGSVDDDQDCLGDEAWDAFQ